MAEIAAITAMPKSAPASDKQSAVTTGAEAMLFAALLAETADGEGTDEQAETANAVPEAATDTAKKADETGDDAAAALMAQPQIPIQLSVLQPNFGAEDDAASKPDNTISANDDAQPAQIKPAQAKTVEDEVKRLLQTKAAVADKATDPTAVDIAIAASAGAGAAVDAQGTDTKAASKKTDVAVAPVGTAQKTQAPTAAGENEVVAKTVAQALATDAAKGADATDKKQVAAQDAAKDDTETVKAMPADKAAALADMADKTVRQTAASNAAQARSLPVQSAAQAPSAPAQNNDGEKSGSGERQATQKDSATQTKGDASRATINAGPPAAAAPSATPGASPSGHETATVQQMTTSVSPQVQTQAQAPVTASVQVAGAIPMAAQPDLSGLAVQIAAKSDEGTQYFSIRLDPAELGRVDVRLSIDDAGRAQAHLSVEKPQTLDLLQRDRTDLERALKGCGVDLSQSGLNFSLKGQERQGEQPTPFKGRSRTLQASLALDTATATTAASTHHFAGGTSRLDIRV